MNAMIGWALAVAALGVGWLSHGWQGVIMAASVVVFWLLLQLSRALRVMRRAGEQPIARLGSAVMMQSRLVQGMTMMKVVGLSRSLGRKVDGQPDSWQWEDDGGLLLTLHFEGGKLNRWLLERPPGAGVDGAETALTMVSAAAPAAPPDADAAAPAAP